jgi:hypothetical protein
VLPSVLITRCVTCVTECSPPCADLCSAVLSVSCPGQGFVIGTECPILLIVRVHPGQRINVTHYDFTSTTTQHGDVVDSVTSPSQITSAAAAADAETSADAACRWPYATISEESVSSREIRLCGEGVQQFQQQRRESHVYMSRTSELRVTLSGKIKRFMLKLEGNWNVSIEL